MCLRNLQVIALGMSGATTYVTALGTPPPSFDTDELCAGVAVLDFGHAEPEGAGIPTQAGGRERQV